MIADTIRTILANLTAFLCVAAIVGTALRKRSQHWSRRYSSWVILLAVAVDRLWAGLFQVFPAIASADRLAAKPFEFEIGVADNFSLLLALTIARAIASSILLWAALKRILPERPAETFHARA